MVDGGFVFEDLISSNGSFFNEIRVKKRVFADGDTIRIGQTLLTYQLGQESQDMTSLVNFEQFDDEVAEYQDRVDLDNVESFLPEKKVTDSSLLRIDYEKLRLGQELLQAMGTERDIKRLLASISNRLIEIFAADRCVILLLNDEGEFEAKAVHGVGVQHSPITVSQSVLKEVRDSKSAVLLSDDRDQDEMDQCSSLKMMGIQSVMCSPLIHENEVIGAVHIDLRDGLGTFTKKDLGLLGGIVASVAMAVANVNLTRKIEKEAQTQAQFERLLSPNIVKQLVDGKLKIGSAGELRHVTIMFADIRGFTSMSQNASPADVVNMLNQFFERVVDIVFKYGGTVDKYMGDEVMVLFGAPIPMKKQEDSALACALEIQRMLKLWNHARAIEGDEKIVVGIGINSGEVLVGSIGSSKTMQYTCIGSAVNIASRLTGLAKAGQVVASKETMVRLKSRTKWKALPPADIKGIDGKFRAYVVDGMEKYEHLDTIG